MNLTEDNFHFVAAKFYRKRLSVSTQAFLLDVNHLELKSDFQKYNTSKESRLLRILINKIVIACNLFGPEATDLILFKLPVEFRNYAFHLFSILDILNCDFIEDKELTKEINEALKRI